MTNSLQALGQAGQAPWLDYLHRKILENGELARRIAEDGLRGMTSNPSIFEKAIGGTTDYDAAIKAMMDVSDADVVDLYERLAIKDIQGAADILRPLYDKLGGKDGFVSLEVSPYLGLDTEGTLAEARRLWRTVDRPNVMIKVPGTPEGVPAIKQLISEGINVNVTLLFSIDAYLQVAEAYIAGLDSLKAGGGDVSKVHGVASFFLSRIDVMIDDAIDERLKGAAGDEAEALKAIRGKTAIASAKIAYQRYLELIGTPRWEALAEAGATPQRLLWASTGTKDKTYSDVIYVETLIGPDTVNTMPPATMDAFRDHGVVAKTLTEDVEGARTVLAEVERLGLDLNKVTGELVDDGVKKFSEAFDQLLGAVADKRAKFLGDKLNTQSIAAPDDLKSAMDEVIARAAEEGWTRRLWQKDATLWTGADEGKWLGWLAAGEGGAVDLFALEGLRDQVKAGGFTHAVLLGMGGSSLGPEVLARSFGAAPGFPKLLVLDSTDPVQVGRIEGMIDPATTLFIVASKSGSTLEPDVLHRYFYDLTEEMLGKGKAGVHFIAVTDPGSKLEESANRDGFLRVFFGDPAIGGRYSVLSNFGMVPAAVIGLDVRAIFETTRAMVRSCGAGAPPKANPGFELGALLGAAGLAGRDKVTLIASDAISDIGAWLEQLIAESTGKQGKGLIPVDLEPLGPTRVYGGDRVFAYIRLDGAEDPAKDGLVRDLETAGQPVVRITLASPLMLFQEFFRWEVAVAVAGAVVGIDPFNQPDVEASKIKTRALTQDYEDKGALSPETPILKEGGLSLFTDAANAAALKSAAGAETLDAYFGAHFRRAHAGDYIGLLAYLDRQPEHTAILQGVRKTLRDHLKVATVLGFGPRFLHSTGQAYKGGPNSGVFLQITASSPSEDLAIPGRKATFGVIEAAEARGDFEVLAERGRRVLRVDLGSDVEGGLKRLADAIERSL
jgi:transaldolase/glucose-6-phosphate isomerase